MPTGQMPDSPGLATGKRSELVASNAKHLHFLVTKQLECQGATPAMQANSMLRCHKTRTRAPAFHAVRLVRITYI
jgi:hypothetical protein